MQIAHLIGGGRRDAAQAVLRQGLMVALALGLALGAVGAGISGNLPVWLHGPALSAGGKGKIGISSAALPDNFVVFAAVW